MASVDTAAHLRARRFPPISDLLLWLVGAILLLSLGWFLISNLIAHPERFAQVSLIGFTNGSTFALIALGYTLVYGILELINFAHGDNFMLGTFETQSIVKDGSFQIPVVFGVIGIPLGTAATASDSAGHRLYAVIMSLIGRCCSAASSTPRSSGLATSRSATSRGSRR